MSDSALDCFVGKNKFFCNVVRERCGVCNDLRFCVHMGDCLLFCAPCLVLIANKICTFVRAARLQEEP